MKLTGRNVSFRRNTKFMDAYHAGINSGHKILDPSDDKLQIDWRVHICCWAAQQALLLNGDFVECGTNTGIVALSICNFLDFNSISKNFYLFDTFEGIPEHQVSESEKGHVEWANEHFYEDCYETTTQNFSPFPNVHLVKGIIPQTLNTENIEKVAFLHIDMNIAYPEKCALEFFWDKISPGGLIIFDDYGFNGYEEQMDVHDAFAKSKGTSILLLPTGQGLLIKPPNN
ncbi:MAG: TylF/MycF family methyltransferase [Chlamydiae bacterium]|nr:TylF/MycF family methyltransferase [Chlamydiota bacterium]